MESSDALKRFYKSVGVEEVESGFAVTLDKRHLKSPAKRPLVLPSQPLAKAIAQEWDAQEKTIKPTTMPLMALASTAVDRIGEMREGVVTQIVKYAETDLVCYWTDEPEELGKRHAAIWQPYVEWAQKDMGVELNIQRGILYVEQPPQSLQNIKKIVEELSDWELSALSIATHVTGSIIIGLALVRGHINSDKAFEDSQVDETYQIELWGEDWEAKDKRDGIKADLLSVTKWLELIR